MKEKYRYSSREESVRRFELTIPEDQTRPITVKNSKPHSYTATASDLKKIKKSKKAKKKPAPS